MFVAIHILPDQSNALIGSWFGSISRGLPDFVYVMSNDSNDGTPIAPMGNPSARARFSTWIDNVSPFMTTALSGIDAIQNSPLVVIPGLKS